LRFAGEEGVLLKILDIENVKAAADTGAKLTCDHRIEVVRRLAGFEQPREIAKAMKEEFGIEITPQAIAFYDPTRYALKRCPKRWAALFWELREEVVKGNPDVGVAHRTVRLRWLDRMARVQMEKGNTAEARALMKQAADEISQMIEQRDNGCETDYSKLGNAELKAQIDADAAKLGYAIVPLVALAGANGDNAAEEPQPAGRPLSG
jgi:hypothetical protein